MNFLGGERLGPYLLVERLGSGGMGEVFLAIDERLDRRVALKRIHAGPGATAERRDRFRREARLAARLNHPSIVQIYDVLSDGEDEILVLEYVEGTTLHRMLQGAPLSPTRAAAIGRDVAHGLAEAHRQGIVHRDLKSENVLVTPLGRGKISDFGVAKRQIEDDGLTASGIVMGTTRSMSPEQARGEPVDFRSDLFSLGILLYEALGGRSPFVGANPLSTVQRILNSEPEPLAHLEPEVPRDLADLVHRLLAKEPHLRPRSAAEVAGVLSAWADGPDTGEESTVAEPAVSRLKRTPKTAPSEPDRPRRGARRLLLLGPPALVLAIGAVLFLLLRPPAPPLEVAILAPTISGSASGEAVGAGSLLSAGVRVAELQVISGLSGVAAKVPDEIDKAKGTLRQIALALNADELIATKLVCRDPSCVVTLDRIRGEDATLIESAALSVPFDDPLLAARAVASRIRAFYPERRARDGAGDLSISSRDFAEFLRLSSRFRARRTADLGTLLDQAVLLSSRSPRFVEGWLLESEIARHRFLQSRDPADLERSLESSRQARNIAPGDPRPLVFLVSAAAAGGRLEIAREALRELERLSPGDPMVLDRRAIVAQASGRPDEALRFARAEAAIHRSVATLSNLAWYEVQQGETAAARATLEELLRRSPDDADGLSQLAYLELSTGDPARAEKLYARLVRQAPRFAPITNLGLSRMVLGRYGEAVEALTRAAALEPANPVARLNLADARLLLGKTAEAEADYRAVLTQLAKDPATATTPQWLTIRGQALAHLHRGAEAVASVQEALRLAPKSPQVAFEAALVYTLSGERLSALAAASRARELGLEPGWFRFPWFDPIRAEPVFQKLSRAGRP